MATKSRTYLPTDWQVWAYAPVSGKFRLNYSTLGGSDVLGGSSDTGSMALLDIDISAINISDGERPSDAVIASLTPATATISASTAAWNSTFVKELYPGKFIAITLKNEASNDVDVYGRNAVFFMGTITDVSYDIDPINEITSFTINLVDIFGNAANQVLSVTKTTSTTQSSTLDNATLNNLSMFNSHLHFLWYTDLAATYEANENVSLSLGTLLTDFINSEVSIPVGYYKNLGLGTLERQILFNPLHTKPTSGTTITDSMVTKVQMETDGGDVPTAFALSNTTATYSKGTTTANTLTNPMVYSATIPVNGTTQLQNIADRIQLYTPALSPTEITVQTATPYQTITFDTTHPHGGGDYYFPNRFYSNGTDLDIQLAYFATGGVTPHYYTKIVGQSHEITPDYWLTTYKLMKGR